MRISCLPLAGPHNPYQRLMRQGLELAGHTTEGGAPGRFFAFTRTVRKQKPDAVHLDWPGSYYLRSNALLCLLQTALFALDLWLFSRTGTPLVWTAHNLKEHETAHPGIDAWAKRRLARVATRIRIFTEDQRQEAAERFGIPAEKIVVVPEGSYVGHYPEGQTRAEARKLLGLPDSARVILHFGNLRPYKGSSALVQAFRQQAGPYDRLILAGPAHNPAYVGALRRAAAGDERIQLHAGFVPEDKVQTYFAAADLAAFPFERIDNSGTVILAMGFGLPCLAPSVGAVSKRLVCQPELLFAPGQLQHRLTYALALSSEQLQALGKANREEVMRYKWEDFGSVFAGLRCT